MSKLSRKDIKIFGNTAPVADLRQFGSTREGSPITSTDPDVLQALTNYEDAWKKGIIASLNIPPLEEFNTLQYLLSRELAYIQQVGIPEFSLTTTYFANKSIVRTPEDSTLFKSAVDDNLGNDIVGVADYDAGTTYALDDLAADTNDDIYRSLSGGNIGNALTNPTFWELTWIFLGDLSLLREAGNPPGMVSAFAFETPPAGWLECDGSPISRTTFAILFAAIGLRFGIGDGSTTFNIPDLRGEFIRGFDNGKGADPDAGSRTDSGDGTTGDNVGTKQADEFDSHTHIHQVLTNDSAGPGGGSLLFSNGVGLNDVTLAAGGNETRPRNVYMMYCIKT